MIAPMPSQREVRERQARSERAAATAQRGARHDHRRRTLKLAVAIFLVVMMVVSMAGGLVTILQGQPQ